MLIKNDMKTLHETHYLKAIFTFISTIQWGSLPFFNHFQIGTFTQKLQTILHKYFTNYCDIPQIGISFLSKI